MTVKLIHGDCLEILRGLPDASVDAVVTDPPYNAISRETGGLRVIDKGVADTAPVDVDALAAEFVRLARGSIYVWCSDEQYTAWCLAFKTRGLTTRKCAWCKSNPSPMNGQRLWLSALELCVFARKPAATFYEFCKAPLWRGPSERVAGHPTPKPIWLMREQIRASVPPGGLVLDPFAGSGTTGLAAILESRRAILIEREAEYVEIARRRIEAARAQLALPLGAD